MTRKGEGWDDRRVGKGVDWGKGICRKGKGRDEAVGR